MTATAAASPVEVKATPVEGGSVRFEVTANAYNLDAPGTYWRYAEGDVRANPEWFGAYYRAWNFRFFNQFEDRVRECDGKATCTYKPSKPGRMYVQTSLKNDDGSWVASHAVTPSAVVGASRIILECNGDLGANHVTRGREITCQAKKDPSDATGDLTITGWSFDGKPRSDGELTSDKWVGIMVRGGTVEVKGKIGTGLEEVAPAAIEVQAREWANKSIPLDIQDRGTGPLPVRPQRYKHLGGWGHTVRTRSDFRNFFDEIEQGPNSGYSFLTGIPFEMDGMVYVNYAALQEGSDFHLRQYRTRIDHWCARNDVVPFIGPAKLHEGGPPPHPKSHGGLFKEKVEAEGGTGFERIVEPGTYEQAYFEASAEANRIWKAAASADDRADSIFPVPIVCNFRFF